MASTPHPLLIAGLGASLAFGSMVGPAIAQPAAEPGAAAPETAAENAAENAPEAAPGATPAAASAAPPDTTPDAPPTPTPDPPPKLSAQEQAAISFKEGRALFKKGQYREAAEKFQAAYNLDPVPILLYNLARAYEEVPDPERAIEFYGNYLKRVPDAEDREDVEYRVGLMRKTIAAARRASVRIVGLPPNPRVLIDGVEATVEDSVVRVEPGKRVIRVEGGPQGPWTRDLDLAKGQVLEVLYGSAAVTTPPPPPPVDGLPLDTIGWISLGTGAGLVGLGAVFYGQASSAADDWTDARDRLRAGGNLSDEELAVIAREKVQAADDVESNGTAAYVLWGLGGAALVVGGALLVLDSQSDAGPGVEAAVVPLPGGVGLIGRF